MMTTKQVSRWRIAWVGLRPWSFPASTMPVLLGTVLAVTVGGAPFRPFRFLVAMLAIVLLHAAANMLSDAFDFWKGVDTEVTPVSGAVVRGWIRPQTAFSLALFFFGAGSALGAGLAWITGLALWWIGGVGVFIGLLYPALKTRALGDGAVFLNFGLLGAAGAWVVQSRRFSFYPMVSAVPIALLVVAILHANNWRDAATDARVRVRTLAGYLGDRGSLIVYGLLLLVPFLWVAALAVIPRWVKAAGFPPLPPGVVLVAAAGPQAWKLWRRACRRHRPDTPLDFATLDGATAQLNLLFGVLYVAGLLFDSACTGLQG